jgi:alanine racemase
MSGRPELDGMRPTWAEIDLRAFDRNVATIVSRLPEESRLIAVLKANAYGHGAVELAKRLDDRVAMIAVILLEEALELRRDGITHPILILGPLTETQVTIAVENDITIGVPGPEVLESVARVARDREVHVHLKLDSGMGRMGIIEDELPAVADLLRDTPNIRLDALYTHLANAGDRRDPFAEEQVARFRTLVATLREAGISAPLHHVANSAGTIRGSMTAGDYVRVGIWLYGAEPMDHEHARLEPVLRWRTAIMRLKELPPGHAVGYGMTFYTKRASRIATLPVGYADGYSRLLSNKGEVLVRGRRAPVVGRVSMDLVTIDVTDIAEAGVGDEVVLLGRQGPEEIAAEELAAKVDTIQYEVLCNVGSRVPRVYLDGQTVVNVRSRFE